MECPLKSFRATGASFSDLFEEATAKTNDIFKKSYFRYLFLLTLFVKFYTASSRDQVGMILDCERFCQKWLLAIKEKSGCSNLMSGPVKEVTAVHSTSIDKHRFRRESF